MKLLISRTYPFIDSESLVEHQARDSLFRTAGESFLLHLSSSHKPAADRLIWFDCRAALVWINAVPDEFGTEWQ